MIELCKTPFCEKFLYRVKDGDTYKSISHQFKVSEQKLKTDNKIEELYTGCVLFVDTTTTKTYVVKPMDTLEKIANKLNIPKDVLIKQNNIKQIFIGQKLEY